MCDQTKTTFNTPYTRYQAKKLSEGILAKSPKDTYSFKQPKTSPKIKEIKKVIKTKKMRLHVKNQTKSKDSTKLQKHATCTQGNKNIQSSSPLTSRNQTIKKPLLMKSPSFEKYGIVTPSFEQILEEQKKYDAHKKLLASVLEKCVLNTTANTDGNICSLRSDTKENVPVLDCRSMTMENLTEAFYNNLDYIKDIMDGKIHSDRHNAFQRPAYRSKSKVNLIASCSFDVFTCDQRLELVQLMEKELDPDSKHTRYFFQVLLPELCLKIFSDVHDMPKKNALHYLEYVRPVDGVPYLHC